MVTYFYGLKGNNNQEPERLYRNTFTVVKVYDGKYFITAAASGFTDSECSDIGAKVATETAAEYCLEHLSVDMDKEGILSVIKEAVDTADRAVFDRAGEDCHSYEDYDVSLCVVVYDESFLYYGQAGDFGIAAVLENGSYVHVSEPRRDFDDKVFQLSCGDYFWRFGRTETPVSAVLFWIPRFIE